MNCINGPVNMYKLAPYYTNTHDVEVPTCMYRLPNYHLANDGVNGGVSIQNYNLLSIITSWSLHNHVS